MLARLHRPVLRQQAAAARWSWSARTPAERELIAEALSAAAPAHGCEIAVPQRGDKRKPLEHALLNAQARRWAAGVAESGSQPGCSRASPTCSAWTSRRERIEVYDNSHIQGTDAATAR